VRKLTEGAPWSLQRAACKGADPVLFDETFGERVFDALSYCDRCPVIPECEDYVQPRRSYFDGVAGGRLWRNGNETEPGLFTIEGDWVQE
jgi:hypothetical protein